MELIKLGTLTQNCVHYLLITPARPRKKELAVLRALEASSASASASSSSSCVILNRDDVIDPELDENEEDFNEDFDEGGEDLPYDPRYPTDVYIATLLLKDTIIANMIRIRDDFRKMLTVIQASERASSSVERGLAMELDEVEKYLMILSLDGDYPNVEVIMSRLEEFGNANSIDFLKHAASCSLSQQTLDLCKVLKCAFANLHYILIQLESLLN